MYRGTPVVKLSMTDADIIQRAAALMGTHCHPLKKLENRKQAYVANVCGDRAINVMRSILPHMGVSRSEKIREVLISVANRPGMHYGERSGSSKLKDWQAAEILNLYVKGERNSERSSTSLAKKYGVTQQAIWYVVKIRRNADGTQPLRPS